MFDITGKNGPKFLSPENSYFLKCLFLSTSKVPKKWWYLLHNNCQNTLWTLRKYCSPTFSSSIIAEKKATNSFSMENSPYFLKSFHQPLRSWRIDLIPSTVIARKPLWTPIKCSLKILIREKTVNYFFSVESLPCSSKIFLFNNLLGPKRMLQVPQ